MLSWIEIAVLYLLGMGLLAWLGGVSSAAGAIERWGRETAERRHCAASSSS